MECSLRSDSTSEREIFGFAKKVTDRGNIEPEFSSASRRAEKADSHERIEGEREDSLDSQVDYKDSIYFL